MADVRWLMARFTQSSGFMLKVKRAIGYTISHRPTIKQLNNQQLNIIT